MGFAATVLCSISSASAFSVSYLDRLGSGSAAPAAPKVAAPSGGTMGAGASYLDQMAPSVPQVVTPPPPVAAAAPAAANTEAVAAGDYLAALAGPPSTIAGRGLTSYLDVCETQTRGVGGAGLTTYSSALPTAVSSRTAGAGIGSYLDNVSPQAAAPPAAAAAPAAAAPAAPAESAGPQPVRAAGAGLTSYLDTVGTQTRAVGGPGFTGYLNVCETKSRSTGGAGLTSYLEVCETKTRAVGGAGLSTYSNSLSPQGTWKSGGKAAAGPSGGAALDFLANVHSQIMDLPDDGCRTINGNTVTYAKAEGSYALSFIKKD